MLQRMMFWFIIFFIPLVQAQGPQCVVSSTTPSCSFCPASTTVEVGANTPTASPTQTCNICLYSAAVNVGSPAAAPAQTVSVGLGAASINIGTAQTVGPTSPTAGVVTLGRTFPSAAPALATSSKINMKGLYHYFYSGECVGNSGASAVIDCEQGSTKYETNAGIFTTAPTPTPTPAPFSGYDSFTNRWYPPEIGYYLVLATAQAVTSNGSPGELAIQKVISGGAAEVVNAVYIDFGTLGGTLYSQMSVNGIVKFDQVGSGNYLYITAMRTFVGANNGRYQRLTVSRIA